MTPELAERVLNRKSKQQPRIPEAKVLEILIDWLDGMTCPGACSSAQSLQATNIGNSA